MDCTKVRKRVYQKLQGNYTSLRFTKEQLVQFPTTKANCANFKRGSAFPSQV